ncbi:YdeI/OmpD-associated family protein [Tahibacter caeni]|uniref:YdeI/OmpD-associated family protein n=1 Tax=Tahibacter caeni TaxID=1453545 RepID=UPI002148BCE6|nr:YdeI/OmpD-associated family protein [Tahibacter caeni]
MGTRDPRVDAYIANAAAFAQPILSHLRDTVHKYCPAVEESIKWGMPYFLHHGMLCGMAAFKQHCSFGFWKGSQFVADARDGEAMGQFGRITSLQDVPAEKVLAGYLRQAMQFNESGVRPAPKSRAAPREPAEVPEDLAAALKKNRKAAATFDAFSPTNRREYVEWISEAKRAETRARRLAQAIEWLAEGKPRNWKYMNC